MQHTSDELLVHEILTWFRANARDLPWRHHYAPYAVWISEVMLQQTQMERGVAYYQRWMERFPTVDDVAAASEDEILKYWEGLGYYSRARNLHKAAKMVVNDLHGEFPNSVESILQLPGVGPYTARAVGSIAFGLDVPVVDANVERVLARVFDIDDPIKSTAGQKRIWELAERLVPTGKARDFNQAVMELGALVCSKRPKCDLCPIQNKCEACRLGITEHRPIPTPPKKMTAITVATGVLIHEGNIFIQRRPTNDVWGGLWEFPGGGVEENESPEQAIVREYKEEVELDVEIVSKLAVIRHGYTRFKVTLHCYLLRPAAHIQGPLHLPLLEATENSWERFEGLASYAFPAGHRKLIDQMGDMLVVQMALGEGRE